MRQRECFEDITYERTIKKEGICKEGCFTISGIHVHAFPHIKRTLNLREGIKRVFGKSRFVVEEKLDGYNLRVVSVDGRAFAFTRTAHVEAFGTEFLRGSPVEELAKDYVVCGEMLGATPYTVSEGWDAEFFVFDLMKDGKFLDAKDKADVLSSYDVKEAPRLGVFGLDTYEKLEEVLKNLDSEGKEGIIMKGKRRMKYVLPKHEARQFEEAWEAPFELPAGFFYERMLRACTASKDLGTEVSTSPEKYFNRALKKYTEKGWVSKEYKVKVKALTTWADILKRLRESKTVDIRVIEVKESSGTTYVRFEKVFKKTTAAFRRWKEGKPFVD